MGRFSLHAVAPDRPGIVAAVTQSLADIGCNLEDSRMTLLRGQFSIVLVFDAPGLSSGAMIEEALASILEQFALQLLVHPISDDVDTEEFGNLVSISAHGADHPGTVSRVAHAVAVAGGNIVDLVGHVVPEDAMTPSHLEITIAIDQTAVADLEVALRALAIELGMRCEVRNEATRSI